VSFLFNILCFSRELIEFLSGRVGYCYSCVSRAPSCPCRWTARVKITATGSLKHSFLLLGKMNGTTDAAACEYEYLATGGENKKRKLSSSSSSMESSSEVPLNEEDDAQPPPPAAAAAAAAAPPEEEVLLENRLLYTVRTPDLAVEITTRTTLPIKKDSYQGGNRKQHPFFKDSVEAVLRKNLEDPHKDEEAGDLIMDARTAYDYLVERNGLEKKYPWESLEVMLARTCGGITLEDVLENGTVAIKKVREANQNVYLKFREIVWWCLHAKKRDISFKGEADCVKEHALSAYAKYRNMMDTLFTIPHHKLYSAADVYRPDTALAIHIPHELMEDTVGSGEKDNDLLMIKDRVRELAKLRRIRRIGKQVFTPVFVDSATEPLRKVFAWAYVPNGLVDDWVVRTVEENFGREVHVALEGSKGNANDVKAYFRERSGLQQLDTTRHMLSFRNGVYFLNRDVFIPHEEMSEDKLLGTNVFSCSFIDAPFETYARHRDCDLPMPTEMPQPSVDAECVWNIPTPYFDKIMRDQHWSYQLQVCMWVAFGRLLYDQDYLDSEQKAMFCWGRKATGKSTICKIISWIYPHHLVGTCSTRSEQTFGLQAFLDKFVIQNSEVKHGWRMELSDWLKMIAGDVVAVAKKFLIPEDVVWRSPFMMAGNEVMDWADEHGAAARRLLIFYFAQNITRSSDLEARLHKELPLIILKSNRFYLAAVHAWREVPFPWPEYFNERRRHFMRNTSLVYKFLSSDNVVYSQELYVPFERLMTVFREVNKLAGERRGSAALNVDPNTWMAALEEWKCTMTEEKQTRRYGGAQIEIVDIYVEGVDLRCNTPVVPAPRAAVAV
jgi:hypothetical protein